MCVCVCVCDCACVCVCVWLCVCVGVFLVSSLTDWTVSVMFRETWMWVTLRECSYYTLCLCTLLGAPSRDGVCNVDGDTGTVTPYMLFPLHLSLAERSRDPPCVELLTPNTSCGEPLEVWLVLMVLGLMVNRALCNCLLVCFVAWKHQTVLEVLHFLVVLLLTSG